MKIKIEIAEKFANNNRNELRKLAKLMFVTMKIDAYYQNWLLFN